MKNKDTNKIIVVGNVPPLHNNKWHQRNDIFDENGVSCTLTATMYKDAPRVALWEYKDEN